MADALSREAAGARTPSALAAATRVCLARAWTIDVADPMWDPFANLNKVVHFAQNLRAPLPWCKDVR
eukprot:9053877-Heterocapsa_arctica.AAC.1